MRAKRINEIRRDDNVLRSMGAGRERVFPALSAIRREIPSIITDLTMRDALSDYAGRTSIQEDVRDYTEGLHSTIDGSFDDYVKVDFISNSDDSAVKSLYHRLLPDELDADVVISKSYWTYRSDGKSDEYVGDRKIYYYPTVDVVLILMWDKPKRGKEVSLQGVFVRNK